MLSLRPLLFSRHPARFLSSFHDPSVPVMLKELEQDVMAFGMRVRGPEDPFRVPLVGETKKPFPLVDREESIGSLCNVLRQRWSEKLGTDKGDHPLHGFHAVPGGGKSFLVDNFMTMDLSKGDYNDFLNTLIFFVVQNLNLMTERQDPEVKLKWTISEKEDFCQKWQKSLRLSMTFNRDFENIKEFSDNPSELVAARLLQRYFLLNYITRH